jgi:hypothetical protein
MKNFFSRRTMRKIKNLFPQLQPIFHCPSKKEKKIERFLQIKAESVAPFWAQIFRAAPPSGRRILKLRRIIGPSDSR